MWLFYGMICCCGGCCDVVVLWYDLLLWWLLRFSCFLYGCCLVLEVVIATL